MDLRQTDWERLEADKRILKEYVSRREKVGKYDRWLCFIIPEGLSAATPMLQDLGAGAALGSGVKALQSYDTVRKQVMDVDERGREHVGRIARAIT